MTMLQSVLPQNYTAQQSLVPVIASQEQLKRALTVPGIRSLFLRHCNIFELARPVMQAAREGYSIYVDIDYINGIHPDTAGMRYLANQLKVTGIVSNHSRSLSAAKLSNLITIQRVFAVDSTGLEMALESIDASFVDIIDFSPAIVLPRIIPFIKTTLTLPFTASGLLYTPNQLQSLVSTGAHAIFVNRFSLIRDFFLEQFSSLQ